MPTSDRAPRISPAARAAGLAASVWLAFALLGTAPALGAPADETRTRPNIIFVLADDHRFDAFGAMTPGLKTPHLDRLIREGVHFTNAFVTTSLCSPSRASILSGQTMRRHGVVDNNSPTPAAFEPFPMHLQQAGYQTAFVGKWHMGRSDASPKPGFHHWVSFEGQGNYGPTDAFGRPSELNVNGERVPQRSYITDELTTYALDWLEARGDDPFFLYLSHKAVHLPFTPAERHQELYARSRFPVPRSADPDARRGPRPMWLAAQRNSWSGIDFAYYSTRSYQDFQRDYFGALAAVDDGIGRLLAWAARQATGRDTVIIYSSDNGFLFGEQGLLDKRAAYEASIRVPMILHAPGRLAAGADRGLARNIDLAPTILDLAGIEPPRHYDGRSLLRGDRSRFDTPLVYEYYWEFNYPQTPSTFAIRDDHYKYVQYHGVWDTEELFDLERDPDELHNLIASEDHAGVRDRLRAALYEALADGDTAGRPAIPFTSRFNRGAVFWNPAASEGLRFPPDWSRTPDAADKYEHFLPDAPGKATALEAITPQVRQVLDRTTPEAEGSHP